jgi:adenylate kinase
MRLILAGPPACGKGTQAELLCRHYGCVHVSAGDLLRAAAASGSLDASVKRAMDTGALVPDEVIVGLVMRRLEADDCRARGFILDGFPRTEAQAELLDRTGLLASVDAIVVIEAETPMLVERVAGRRIDPKTNKIYHLRFSPPPQGDAALTARLVHRADDTEERVLERIRTYERHIEPLLRVCQRRVPQRILRVHAAQQPETVFGEIISGLDRLRTEEAKAPKPKL